MERVISLILITLVSVNGIVFCNPYPANTVKIIPNDWQHWKSAGAHFDLAVTTNGFVITIIKNGNDVRDIQVYSNNDLKIETAKRYIVRLKVRSNKNNISFSSRLGSESENKNYYFRVIKVDKADRTEAKEIRFSQQGELIKFLKLYFEFGQLDPDTKIEISDVEISEE